MGPSTGIDFLQGLGAASSVQEVQEVHADFLAAAAQPCMASPEASWHLIYSVLRKLLDLCLHLHSLTPLLQVGFGVRCTGHTDLLNHS